MSDTANGRGANELMFNAFEQNCVSLAYHGVWAHPDSQRFDYTRPRFWTDLAKTLERGGFDSIFLADVVGVHDIYKGGYATSVAQGMQTPGGDPSVLIPLMSAVTEHLGFVFTQSILQEPPFNFARRISTLDHITEGRVGWNIVTSHLASAARNLGWPDLPEHDTRYAMAAEYLEVCGALWQHSWEDGAVLRDKAQRRYADPSKVHRIDYQGKYYQVPGPHLSEPSPQRTPVLFQAGSSEAGRAFAARNAEAIFLDSTTPLGAQQIIADIRRRALQAGRDPSSILFFQGLTFVVGGTDEEARAKDASYREYLHEEAFAAQLSSAAGQDISVVDLNTPLEKIRTNTQQGWLNSLRQSAPDQAWTLGEVLLWRRNRQIVGCPERLADELQKWKDAGVDGINVTYVISPGSFEDFSDGLAPELRKRGLLKQHYRPGTLRQKMFGNGDRLATDHPVARGLRAH
ncbi:LLM class flavin-dependent oxidoreductase [Pseudomonas tolaasii]|uniref:LLM class flavin-dependent oxidoreductase n=1 Tax=Pseudomonas tolaasii TaxID=29442 RepID=UPI001C560B3F|nr:LLM class flavin-dependent oxidoreductase [Pseudomonas tolaasii]MBW1248820.1 LLM class flavin-dependent oxidoreductase [Pseudomonas tolaasii]